MMYLVIQRRVDDSLQCHWFTEVKLDPKNGGWIVGTNFDGTSVGFSVDQCGVCTRVPELLPPSTDK